MISGKDLPHVYQKAITLQMHASSISCELSKENPMRV
jgi:hypothetical protein